MTLAVFAQVLLTVLVVVGVGLLLRRKVGLDVQSIKGGDYSDAFFKPSGWPNPRRLSRS